MPTTGRDETPWFLWDRELPASEVRRILRDRDDPRRLPILATLLREARPDEVWSWVSPREVAAELPALRPRLGRKAAFWEWLLRGWEDLGLLA